MSKDKSKSNVHVRVINSAEDFDKVMAEIKSDVNRIRSERPDAPKKSPVDKLVESLKSIPGVHVEQATADHVSGGAQFDNPEEAEAFIQRLKDAGADYKVFNFKDKHVEMLNKIAFVPLPVSVVTALKLSIKDFKTLVQLKRAKLVKLNYAGDRYVITHHGATFIKTVDHDFDPIDPDEVAISENHLSMNQLGVLLCLTQEAIDNDKVETDGEGETTLKSLAKIGLVDNCGDHWHLAKEGRDFLSKLLAVPFK